MVRAQRSVPLDVIFGVNSEDDGAIPAIRMACARLEEAGLSARLRVAPITGPNRKVTILEGCLAEAGDAYDTILWADSNVDLTGFDLDQLIRQLKSSPRAVGNACRRNPVPIFIPCHRVVAGNGKIGGFSSGTELKRYLLDLEGKQL